MRITCRPYYEIVRLLLVAYIVLFLAFALSKYVNVFLTKIVPVKLCTSIVYVSVQHKFT